MKVKHLYRTEMVPGGLFAIPDAPQSVMFDLTWQCNQRCRFCYVPDDRAAQPLPDKDVQVRIVRQLGNWGVEEVLYLGGEPTLCPHLDDVLTAGHDVGLRQRLVTNGLRVNRSLARRMAALSVEIGVSFAGADANVHDSLVQLPGAFNRTVNGMTELVDAGVATFLHFSPTRPNAGHLERLVAWAASRWPGALRSVEVNRLLPQGRAQADGVSLLVDEDGWWEVLLDAAAVAERGFTLHVESVPRCWVRERAKRDALAEAARDAILTLLRPCRMAIVQLALDPSGRIKLCPGGSPVGDPLTPESLPTAWRVDSALERYRRMEWLPVQCVDYARAWLCPEFHDCAAGCRYGAVVSGPAFDPLAPPPQSSASGSF